MPLIKPELLAPEFERERHAEYKRFRSSQLAVKISNWNPQRTMRWDEEGRAEARQHIRSWSARWWQERGYRMIVTDESTDEITVEPLEPKCPA